MKERIPEIAITTDIIVGFPNETEEEFEDTLDMLRRVQYDNIYSFIYSKRAGTPAAKMEGQIPADVQGARFSRLLEVQNAISHARNEVYEGKIVRVLVEGRSKTDDTKLTGRTERNRLVHFEGDDSLIGQFADILVTGAQTHSMTGELKK